MDIEKRIAQFENMAQADASNEMAHFSLGKAYADAGRFGDAAQSYLRCVQLVPDMSKAYQLAGEMLIKAGDEEQAGAILMRGYATAAGKGDLMPKTAIGKLLQSIGRTPPEVPGQTVSVGVASGGVGGAGAGFDPNAPLPEGMVMCVKAGRPGTRMARPPFRGRLGEWIGKNISQETFYKGWVPQGTKVINELRLDLSREKDQEQYDQHMREYLGIDDALLTELGLKE
jgi:Fe-S cluster biosynthesis and repair protein YggX